MKELMRRWIRDSIGYRSPMFVFASEIISLIYCISGGTDGIKLFMMRNQTGNGRWLKFRTLEHPIYVRPGTDDVHSVVNNILRNEYGQLDRGFHPETVVDAGAYMGDTTAYFATRFPAARCVALEPSPENFPLAVRNLAAYGERVELLNAALWSSVGSVMIGGAETSATLSDRGVPVCAIDVPEVMERLGVSRLNLLKMDIEGSELAVLSAGDGGWLKRVDVLLLEMHGGEIEAALLPLLARNGFSVDRFRNVWYCHNLKLDS